MIFEKAVLVPYKGVEDLAAVWCEWAEMELRHNNFAPALALMRRATTKPNGVRAKVGGSYIYPYMYPYISIIPGAHI